MSPPAPEENCLNCRYMDEPDKPHKYHDCICKPILPETFTTIQIERINRERPFSNCKTWVVRRF